jgi:hypothetical protein
MNSIGNIGEPEARGKEKRVLVRRLAEGHVAVRKFVILREDDAEENCDCVVIDISPNGLRLLTSSSIGLGTQLDIHIEPVGFRHAHLLQGIVRWQSSAGDVAGYSSGIELVNQRNLRAWIREFH